MGGAGALTEGPRDYLDVRLDEAELGAVSNLGLAHIGDGVYDLLMRTWLVTEGRHTNRSLHAATVERVKASAQARAMETLLPLLTEAERAVYRRGRNTHVNTVPRSAGPGDYHSATGLECLFGWLYLRGERGRINELFDWIVSAERP